MRRSPLLALLATLALASGCGGSGARSSSPSGADGAKAAGSAGAPAGGTGTGAGSTVAGAGSTGVQAAPGGVQVAGLTARPATVNRQVVRTALIAVTVDQVESAADGSVRLAKQAGGLVESDTRSREGRGSAHLVLRVPPAAVERTLTGLSELGKESRRDVGDTDVTEQSVDLASRLATQRASVARVRALLARASSIAEITAVEGELTRREAELESLQNRSAALAGQVELATVTVTLTGKAPHATVVGDAGFLDGLSGGWDALAGSARVASVVAGALLPFLPLLVLGLLSRVLWRRVLWRRRRSAAATP